MAHSQWHKFYEARIAAPAALLFDLLADMPNYGRWLPGSDRYGGTTEVEPYPVRLGTRYHDGRPGEPGKDWWGTVTGYQPPGSLDFRHTIHVRPLAATVDVHIHYSLEGADEAGDATRVGRWLVLDIRMPVAARALRGLITASFDEENARTMAALAAYAQSHASGPSPAEG
jgi:hypothetical protein